jgi:RimJ/RimL family protein N-acetyltransferase
MRGADYSVQERLNDGTAVTVRAIRPDDKARVLRAFHALAAESIYTRFFGMKKALSDQDLRQLTEIDHARDVALVVVLGEQLIGGGRYMASDATAEIAFTVEEDYQRKGVTTRVLRHLVRIARENGIEAFEAFVLPENRAMLGVFKRCGLPMETKRGDGLVRVTLRL